MAEFPSPYGVSFILIHTTGKHRNLFLNRVSVSLRSIIHSYIRGALLDIFEGFEESFRLLTEYHSFLCKK